MALRLKKVSSWVFDQIHRHGVHRPNEILLVDLRRWCWCFVDGSASGVWTRANRHADRSLPTRDLKFDRRKGRQANPPLPGRTILSRSSRTAATPRSRTCALVWDDLGLTVSAVAQPFGRQRSEAVGPLSFDGGTDVRDVLGAGAGADAARGCVLVFGNLGGPPR